jgi:hypothetical protein
MSDRQEKDLLDESALEDPEVKEVKVVEEVVEDDLLNLPVDGSESPIYEMAAIAGGFINIRLAIYGNEGNYPHFHFYHNTPANQGIKNQGYGGGCLMIKEPIYFIHGSHTETLGNDEIEPLLKFLNSKYVNPKIDMTNWQYLVHLWNENNPRTIVDGERYDTPPPYVKNMKSYKEKNP